MQPPLFLCLLLAVASVESARTTAPRTRGPPSPARFTSSSSSSTSPLAPSSQYPPPRRSRRKVFIGLPMAAAVYLGTLRPRLASSTEPAADASKAAPSIGLTKDLKLRGCTTPNCISTSSRNPGSSMSAWRGKDTQSELTSTQIVTGLLRIEPSSKLIEQIQTPKGEYLRFEVPSSTGFDDLEFFISNEGVPERGFDGDFPGNLILFRSFERQPKFIYPFQTPIGDLGRQKNRLKALREAIGARVVGCELIECYDTRLT